MGLQVQYLPVGTLLGSGKYRIVRFIGAGGFGCTYEAEFVRMNSRVAIKEFFVSSCCNRDATGVVSVGTESQKGLVGKLEEKFRTEAKRLFKMKHSGIVRVSDMFEENGTSYYVMDYIDGHSLQSVLDHEGAIPEHRVLRYIGQVMDALEYVHGKNMLHLDIKPDNIMIDASNDCAILIDFGVSKQYDEVDGHNTSTIIGHTPGYAPPEQIGNSLKQFTPAADIYALGATFYASLTGRIPPSSNDIVSGDACLHPLPAGTSAATRRAITIMMQPVKAHRPQTIAAVRALLAAPSAPSLHGLQTSDKRQDASIATATLTAPVTTVKSKQKKWLWPVVSVMVVVAAVVVTVLLSIHSSAPSGSISIVDALVASDTLDAANGGIGDLICNGHEYVDLGLPSGLKWATMNVGANSPADYGLYFAWGETVKKRDFNEDNSVAYNHAIDSIGGNPQFDVACASWGGNWRMPTQTEFKELLDHCTCFFTTMDSHNGYMMTGPNGKQIFFPAAGCSYSTSLYNDSSDGYYWSSSPYNGSQGASGFYFNSDGTYKVDWSRRFYGRSVRPVIE